jgi:hypothetical protein
MSSRALADPSRALHEGQTPVSSGGPLDYAAGRRDRRLGRAGDVGAPLAGAADRQPPTAPPNVRVLAVKPDTVTIAFTGSTDNAGLKWYVLPGSVSGSRAAARVEGVRQQATTTPNRTEIGAGSPTRCTR